MNISFCHLLSGALTNYPILHIKKLNLNKLFPNENSLHSVCVKKAQQTNIWFIEQSLCCEGEQCVKPDLLLKIFYLTAT